MFKDLFSEEKVIVTGGAGFIGSHIVDTLISYGAEVHIIDNLSSGKKENCNSGAALHVLDVRDRDALQEVFKGSSFVFHLAAIVSVPYSIEHPAESHDVNVTGTLNVLEAAREAGVKRLVFSSSSAIYGEQEKMPIAEDRTPSPQSPYGLHKYIGEQMCMLWSALYDLQTVSLRYFNVYGTRQNPDGAYAGAVGKFIKLHTLEKPLTITGDGEQTRDFIAVEDVVRANILASTSKDVGKGEHINIGTGQSVSVNEIAQIIGGETEYIPARQEPRHSEANIAKAQTTLAWAPEVAFGEGLKNLLKS